MPRKPRIEFAGAHYHVVAHGNLGTSIFEDREDSLKFLEILGDVAEARGWHVYAFCLMPNHFHLLLQTEGPNLSKGMQQLNGRYAQWVNLKRGLTGHLLQGRYKAILVDRDEYLLELVRHVDLVPVRAGLAERPDQWLWSSHRHFANPVARPPAWLRSKEVLAEFGQDPELARSALSRFMEEGLEKPERDVADFERVLETNKVLGSKTFIEKLSIRLGLTENLRPSAAQSLSEFEDQFMPREKAMAAAHFIGGYRQKDIADAFGIHPSTVSRAKVKYKGEFE